MEGHACTLNLNLAQLLRLRVAFHTLTLFHLRTFALKNYATVEINPKRRLGMSQNGHNQWQSKICQRSEILQTFCAAGHQALYTNLKF